MLLWMVAIISMIVLGLMLAWYRYQHNIDWQIKFLAVRLNRKIHCQRGNRQRVQPLLKTTYRLIHESIITNNSLAAYQALDLLKLAFGSGMVRPGEASQLMAISITALNGHKTDIVSFILDAFRPLVRQLPPADVVGAINQLTLISVVALRQKQNFLAGKGIECIFYIIEQSNIKLDKNILTAALKAFKVIGIMGLRRRDMALFREMNIRLSVWLLANPNHEWIVEELVNMLTGWLYRISGINEVSLFTIVVDFTFSLMEAEVLTDEASELLIDEWGNIAATACLNPYSQMAGLIIEFVFKATHWHNTDKQWCKSIAVAGRVAKLAVSRHGLVPAFMVVYPILECGRKMLWAELKFAECSDNVGQQRLFKIVRECLLLMEYAARQDLLGSTSQSLNDIYGCWMGHPDLIANQKSIKKYCQLLMLCWVKNKRQSRRKLLVTTDFMEPILFSDSERQRLYIE